MLPKFEEELQGMAAGEQKSFTINAEEGYGERQDNSTVQLPVAMFEQSGMPPVGAILPLQDPEGNHLNAIVLEVSPEAVTVDLNHQMAGKTLNFEIEVEATRPATEEELAHGHAHGIDGNAGH